MWGQGPALSPRNLSKENMNLSNFLGLASGLGIGSAFAWWQFRVMLQTERAATTGRLARVPGSVTRVAMLLLALVAVQVLLPSANLLWVTAGLFLAMALPLSWRLHRLWQQR